MKSGEKKPRENINISNELEVCIELIVFSHSVY